MFSDILRSNWFMSVSGSMRGGRSRFREGPGGSLKTDRLEVSENGHLPTPLPACACRRSSSLILGLISAPDCWSQARNAWPTPSKSAIVEGVVSVSWKWRLEM